MTSTTSASAVGVGRAGRDRAGEEGRRERERES